MRLSLVLVVTLVAFFAAASATDTDKKSSAAVAPAQAFSFDYGTTNSKDGLPTSKDERLYSGGRTGNTVPIVTDSDGNPTGGTAGESVRWDQRLKVWWALFKAWWKRTFGDEAVATTSTRGTSATSREERIVIGSHTEVGMPIGGGTNKDTSDTASSGYTVSAEGTSLDVRVQKWWEQFKAWWNKKFGSEVESASSKATTKEATNTRRLRQ
ncbi:hypothetical protein PHYBOEH_003383 [Phytophthora boehmeriae]|uniref:RxLR effector protein n=1 Tax=Phytophthora boehmeriae TaxID=109152 RepID=A0A8T1WSR4_9STRA|nr:hypothetical protein PHYBOEH_003383 [Phytophthora boehmeriae]